MIKKIKAGIAATLIVSMVLPSVLWIVNTASGFFYTEVAVFMAIGAPIFWNEVYKEFAA